MKKLSLLLAVLMCLSLAFGSVSFASDVDTPTNPFSGQEYTFWGNGIIFVLMHHEQSLNWREYTAADFPELDVERVKTHIDLVSNYEIDSANPEFRNFVYVILKDKSDEAMVAAINALYARRDIDIFDACPASDVFYLNDEARDLFPELYLPIGGTFGASQILFFSDKECTNQYDDVSSIPAGSTVYYKIICADGYFCGKLTLNSGVADESSFVMPDDGIEATADIYRYGDTNGDDVIDVSDVVFLLKYLAGYSEIAHKVNGSGCGNAYLDFNNDGKVDVADCVLMLKNIAGWENSSPVAPDHEDSFTVSHTFTDAATDAFRLNNDPSATADVMRNYIQCMMTSLDDWASFVDDMFSLKDSVTFINGDGSPTGDVLSFTEVAKLCDDEFFERYDLLLVTIAPGNVSTVNNITKSGTSMTVDFAFGTDSADTYTFHFIGAPKGSVTSWKLTANGAQFDPSF